MENSIAYFGKDFIKNILDSREAFYRNPTDIASFIYGVSGELQKLGLGIIKEALEEMDRAMCESDTRKRKWYVERHESKKLVTSLGTVDFSKTLFSDKESRKEMCYLVDRLAGFAEHQRMTEDAAANILKEAVQTSYRKGGESVNPTDTVSKEAVKDALHDLKFPPNYEKPKGKKAVENLYIDADEDHISLQFQQEKGDLEEGKSGRKKNGAITKLIYVYEGVEPVAPKSKRHRLINPHYFCRVTDDNKGLWDEVYAYLDATYDLSGVKRIFLNADGGLWIKEGCRAIADVWLVLDEFHLNKYMTRMTGHMMDTMWDARDEMYNEIRKGTKEGFLGITERLAGCAPDEATAKRIREGADYICGNWMAARRRLQRRDAAFGCSAEGHVSHVLSSRMSSRPMGWSRLGAAQMARLREYYYNKGDFLRLATYQKEAGELPLAAGGEDVVLSASEIIQAENCHRTKLEAEYGKYSEAMSHTWGIQTRKQFAFYSTHWLHGI